jgi:hypothetical protein
LIHKCGLTMINVSDDGDITKLVDSRHSSI